MKKKDIYLSMEEAIKRYGYSRQWFYKKRWDNIGPKFIKINGKLHYPLKETDKWFYDFIVKKYPFIFNERI